MSVAAWPEALAFSLSKDNPSDRVVALVGNPNVGKSTVFNELTGMNQHTGNWPGKTVTRAEGRFRFGTNDYILVDLPGTYSLFTHSYEEEVARDFILYGAADVIVVICDATCVERNLNLVLQVLEITSRVVVCVNLIDEATKKGIYINLAEMELLLGVPVVATSARSGKGLDWLMARLEEVCFREGRHRSCQVRYPQAIEEACVLLQDTLPDNLPHNLQHRWLSLRLLEQGTATTANDSFHLNLDPASAAVLAAALQVSQEQLELAGISQSEIQDNIVAGIVGTAEAIAAKVVRHETAAPDHFDRRLDRIFTSKATGIPVMLVLLCAIFWLTICGANIPSQILSDGLFWLQDRLSEGFIRLNAPDWLHGMLVLGVYRVLAWVVSVMLPPMAIFFPLFTLLEDFGYLPRVAFNLDHQFKKAKACGKQALTMCMGFGCNAVGIIGCRIIDSPRERLIAILTNNFVPCNGRFPTLIAIISMFFVGGRGGFKETLLSTVILTGVIVFGVWLTFQISRFLSQTILQGETSSFALELPPYRTPQIGKVILRSVFDRTLFVLKRAVAVAAPAGLIIWIMSNFIIGDASLLAHCAAFLDPFAHLLGLDGVILIAFILGFPANEIVIPIIIMAYMSTGSIMELDSLLELKALLLANGWTWVTAVSTMLFCLCHWPCSTTCLTIHQETGSFKWTALSFLIPTGVGMAVCLIFTFVVRLLGF